MTQEKKTDNSRLDEELADRISSAVTVGGMYEALKCDKFLEEVYFAIACMFAHIIATKDEVAMQDFRASIGLEDKRPEAAKGVSND